MVTVLETFSFFPKGLSSSHATAQCSIEDFHRQLKTNAGWKFHIDRIQKIRDEAGQKKAKASLPAITVSAFIPTGQKRAGIAEGDLRHTGLIQADFDDVVGEAAQRLIKRLRVDPHTRLIFRSPRGKAKAFFKVSAPSTAHEHKAAFSAVVNHCHLNGYGVIDTIVAPINSLCFISHDPEAALKDATPLGWDAAAEQEPLLAHEPIETPDFQFNGNTPQWLSQALAHIDADDYQVWLAVGSALKHGGVPFEVWDLWSQASDKYNPSDAKYKWHKGFNRIPFDYITKTAQRNGWAPPWGKQRPKPVLNPQPMKPPRQGWREQQDEISKAFDSEHDTILIKADAGVGKDYAKTSYIVQSDVTAERFVEMVPRVELGDEKVTDFQRRQEGQNNYRGVYQWRSVFHNHDNSRPFHIRMSLVGEGLMCVQPGKFDALRQKGATPQAVLCPSCPVNDTCRSKGYLSQVRKAQEADYLLSAQDGVFFDKALAGFAQKIIKSTDRTATGVVDEVRAIELFSECRFSKSELQRIGETWNGTPAGQFAIEILQALELGTQSDFKKVRETVLNLSGGQRKIIIQAFTRHRIHGRALFGEQDKIYNDGVMLASGTFYPKNGPSAVAIATSTDALTTLSEKGIPAVFRSEMDKHGLMLSYQQAIKFGFYEIPEDDTTDGIEAFPKLYPNPQWTPLHQLQSLFEQYPRPDDTPISYDSESLNFCLPPEIHPSIDKLIMMSATAETEIIRDKVFPERDVQVIETEPTKWMPGTQVFQIKSGKYPRASVLDNDNNLQGFGHRAWEAMCVEIERNPDTTHAAITYKSLVEKMELPANVITAHYGAAEGENERYAGAGVFWILFDPRLPPHEVARRARAIYGRDAEPLIYDYDAESGLYTDARLQGMADQYATGEIIQAVGRARLVRREGITVVILTGRELPGISGRAETTLFDLEDLIIAEGLDYLKDRVHNREAQEGELREAIKRLLKEGASDNKICQTLGMHHVPLARIKAEMGMSQSSQPAISTLIAGCEDVTNSIKALIASGITSGKDISERILQSPAATRQRLTRMVKSGELIRTGRGVYALPNARCDFLPDTFNNDFRG